MVSSQLALTCERALSGCRCSSLFAHCCCGCFLCREPLANLAQCQVLVDRLDAELAARPQQAFHSPRRRKSGKREEEEKAPTSRPIQPLSKGKGKQQPAAAEAAGSKRAKRADAEAEPSKKRAKKEQTAAAAAAAGQEQEAEEEEEKGSEELSEDEWEITKITVRHSNQFWEKKRFRCSLACSHVTCGYLFALCSWCSFHFRARRKRAKRCITFVNGDL